MPEIRLDVLAAHLGAEVRGDGALTVTRVQPLDEAGPGDLSFLHNTRYVEAARASRATAILVEDAHLLPDQTVLVCAEPYLAMARALDELHPQPLPAEGVHPSAWVADDVALAAGVSVGPNAVVEAGCQLGERVVVGAGCLIGRDVVIGEGSRLHQGVIIRERCRVGSRCVFQPGVVIGGDGFGFATVDGVHHKVPQVGIVVIEDDVELGAGVCVDRATLGETVIGRGAKIDNLVQIAHNVRVGAGSILVSQVGIAGSTTLGQYVVMGGQAGAAGHLKIGDGAQITAKTAVFKDVAVGETVSGNPARPHREFMRSQAAVGRLADLRRRVAALEKRIDEGEG
jgi:UDP-3-O-[3-hydroxymyristoyl] glucosamine N-acyltransferase